MEVTISTVPATAKMDTNTMHRGNVKDFPSSPGPLWSLVIGKSLNLLDMMNNTVYFNSFPFISSTWLKDIFTIFKDKTKGHSSPGQRGKFPTFQSYLNTVPRISLVSDEVYCQINPERRGIVREKNEEIGSKDEVMQMCLRYTETASMHSESDSDTSLSHSDDKNSESLQNIRNPETRLKDVSADSTHLVLYQSTSEQSGSARAPSVATSLRYNEYETEVMREIKDILEGIDGEDRSDEDDDDVVYRENALDEIQILKRRSNEYIRNDFDLMSSNRLPYFDPFGKTLPRYMYNEDLNTGLLAELLNSFGMKYKISKYRHKPNRINSNEIFCKNLFLKDRKGKYFYIICNEDENLNLKKAAKFLGAYRNLSFASETDTYDFLRVERGGLTPFALLYDRECKIKVVCTTDLLLKADRLFNFHPFDSNLTLCLRFEDLKNYLAIFNHSLDFLPI